jgi:hypothetical protein
VKVGNSAWGTLTKPLPGLWGTGGRLPHGPIVRLVQLSVDEQVNGMAELLEHHATELTRAVIVTVTRGRIRIRR